MTLGPNILQVSGTAFKNCQSPSAMTGHMIGSGELRELSLHNLLFYDDLFFVGFGFRDFAYS